jgi:muconate cycloisomerase
MLDESLCGYPDAESAVKFGTADMLNVRLSKCGGILPSLRIIGIAQRSGLGLQLGCHPGETAILSAAGRHVASRVDGISYLEGSYDRHILKTNLARDDITFGYGGRAQPLGGPGLGIQVDPAALATMTIERREFTYD